MAKAKGRGRGKPPMNKVVASDASTTSTVFELNDANKTRSGGSKGRLRNDEEIRDQILLATETLGMEKLIDSEVSDDAKEIDNMEADCVKNGEVEPKEDRKKDDRKPWVDVIKGNRQIRRGMAMDFEAPTMKDGEAEVEIMKEDIESELNFWKAGLIIFAVGRELSMNAVKQFMEKVWNSVALPELYYHEQGYFLARFKSVEDRDEILHNGPYSIYSSPLFICKWSAEFVLKEDLLRMMPIWVKFPNLPLHFWGEKSLSKIASAIGRPVSTDECTARKLRISYARVLIEVDITQERKQEVRIKEVDGSIYMQRVIYEWVPEFCSNCQQIGHDCIKKQQMADKKVWRPKELGNLMEEAVSLNVGKVDKNKKVEKSKKEGPARIAS